ncbi:hypothetical protein MUP46_02795 [Patescibacteria group bacterium]|nr:hypothetical protein [Patescibacteria group bacterium]
MQKIISHFLPFLLFVFLAGTYFFAFLSQNYAKGTFATDEPGVVISSLIPSRSLAAIFKDAAITAQPPLESIIREKIYVPLGKALGVSKIYPEFFHRFISFLWWIIPIGYLCLHFKEFSRQRKLTITFAFLLIVSTPFMRFYLAEARHYSAIAATFATMLIILLSDNVTYYQLRYRFLVISLLPPLLHIISFPYWFILVVFFFYRLKQESFQKHKAQFFDLITIYGIYLPFIIWMYFQISKIAADWQRPDLKNISFSFINIYLKWTIDWIFYQTPLYPIFKIIPNILKNNLVTLFGIFSIPSFLLLIRKIFLYNNKVLDVTAIFPIIITFIWPLTIAAVTFRSGYFSGERYSIAMLTIIFFGLSSITSKLLYKIKNNKIRHLSISLVFILIAFSLFPKIISAKYFNLETAENRFVKENKNLLMDGRNFLILDNGGYSSSIATLAVIFNVPLRTHYIACREGTFYSNGKNILNDWLKSHSKDKVYFLTTGMDLEGNNKIIWESGLEKLYLLASSIGTSSLCSNLDTFGECYMRCTKGYDLSPDGRSIPGTVSWLGIYRP